MSDNPKARQRKSVKLEKAELKEVRRMIKHATKTEVAEALGIPQSTLFNLDLKGTASEATVRKVQQKLRELTTA